VNTDDDGTFDIGCHAPDDKCRELASYLSANAVMVVSVHADGHIVAFGGEAAIKQVVADYLSANPGAEATLSRRAVNAPPPRTPDGQTDPTLAEET
jgi:hypothetical protein